MSGLQEQRPDGGAVTGKAKFADQMAKHLKEPIEAACPITRPGGTTTQIAGSVGGAAGAVIAAAAKNRGSDVEIGQFAWLGLGPDHLAITKSSFMGKPTGDPLSRVAYSEVTEAAVTEAKLTLRVDLDLDDGRHIAFEVKRHGQNKPNVEVIDLLRERCARS
jgi:hypothetical protein